MKVIAGLMRKIIHTYLACLILHLTNLRKIERTRTIMSLLQDEYFIVQVIQPEKYSSEESWVMEFLRGKCSASGEFGGYFVILSVHSTSRSAVNIIEFASGAGWYEVDQLT